LFSRASGIFFAQNLKQENIFIPLAQFLLTKKLR